MEALFNCADVSRVTLTEILLVYEVYHLGQEADVDRCLLACLYSVRRRCFTSSKANPHFLSIVNRKYRPDTEHPLLSIRLAGADRCI